MSNRKKAALAIFLIAGMCISFIAVLIAAPGREETIDPLIIIMGFMLASTLICVGAYITLYSILAVIEQGLISPRRNYLSQWQHLRIGMTESEVRQLTGSPRQIEALVAMTGEMASRWHYGSLLTKGTITFHGGRVISFSAPRM